jgi:hypothetical protein
MKFVELTTYETSSNLESVKEVALVEASQIMKRYDAGVFWKLLIWSSVVMTLIFITGLGFVLFTDFEKEASRKDLSRMRRKTAKALKKGSQEDINRLYEESHCEFVYRKRKELVAIRKVKLDIGSGKIFGGKGEELGIVQGWFHYGDDILDGEASGGDSFGETDGSDSLDKSGISEQDLESEIEAALPDQN